MLHHFPQIRAASQKVIILKWLHLGHLMTVEVASKNYFCCCLSLIIHTVLLGRLPMLLGHSALQNLHISFGILQAKSLALIHHLKGNWAFLMTLGMMLAANGRVMNHLIVSFQPLIIESVLNL
jgi:hypothetical protein